MFRTSSFLPTLLGIILIALLGCGVYIYWDNSKPLSSITIQENSTKTVQPDKATIDVIISLKDLNINKIKTEIDTKTNAILDYLQKENIP